MASQAIVPKVGGSAPLKNLNQEKFCDLFATDGEFFGCAADAYIEAYDLDRSKPNCRNVANASASKLLKNSMVLARINHHLETRLGLNDAEVDKQLAFLISQSADMRTKLAAIREYNALKGRVKKKIELSFTEVPDTELDTELKALEDEIAQAHALVSSRRAAGQEPDNPRSGLPNLTDAQRLAMASDKQQIIDIN